MNLLYSGLIVSSPSVEVHHTTMSACLNTGVTFIFDKSVVRSILIYLIVGDI